MYINIYDSVCFSVSVSGSVPGTCKHGCYMVLVREGRGGGDEEDNGGRREGGEWRCKWFSIILVMYSVVCINY